MKIIITIILAFIVSACIAQPKNHVRKTVTHGLSSYTDFFSLDTISAKRDTLSINTLQVLTFRNVKMIPIDTTYSGDNYNAYQTIRTEVIINGKSSILAVKSRYNGKYWNFDSCSYRAIEPTLYLNQNLPNFYFK
jgi:hypothetical protein